MLRILISGAGIAGPTSAYWLARAGHSITLVERSPTLEPIGQNIDVDGCALQVMQMMGLSKGLCELNTSEVGTRFIRTNGRGPFASFPIVRGKDVSPTSENEILRGDLAMLLCSATLKHPNVRYLLGTTIEKISPDERGGGEEAPADHSSHQKEGKEEEDSPPLRVELSNGETGTYDICILADGQWSRLRKEHFPPPTIVDKNLYIAYFTVPRTSVDQNWWEIYMSLASRGVHTRPDSHGTTRACLMKMPLNQAEKAVWEKASRSGNRRVQNQLLEETFEDAGWESKRLLKAMIHSTDFYFQAVKQIRMEKWSDEQTGRIVCIGDAAYAPTPLSGSGAVLAILGGYILAGEITRLCQNHKNEHPRRALEAYENTLRPYVEKVQDLPRFVPGVVMPSRRWHRALLQNFLWVAAKMIAIPWLQPNATRHDESDFKLPIYPVFQDGLAGETREAVAGK